VTPIQTSLHQAKADEEKILMVAEGVGDGEVAAVIAELEAEMLEASGKLEFEKAAIIPDQIASLKGGSASHEGGRSGGKKGRKQDGYGSKKKLESSK
jgi:excinuclease ABC subunit B